MSTGQRDTFFVKLKAFSIKTKISSLTPKKKSGKGCGNLAFEEKCGIKSKMVNFDEFMKSHQYFNVIVLSTRST